MCCPFLRDKGKHRNKIPRKSQENAGTVRDNPVKIMFMRFLVYCFLFWPQLWTFWRWNLGARKGVCSQNGPSLPAKDKGPIQLSFVAALKKICKNLVQMGEQGGGTHILRGERGGANSP